VVSVGVGIAVGFGLLPLGAIILLFFGGLLITAGFARRVGQLAAITGKMQETLRQYGQLVALLENQSFQSAILQEQQNELLGQGQPVSKVLKRLNRLINALDQRNNLLVAIFGNAFFLWDLRQGYAIEKWIDTYGGKVAGWFDVLARMDAYNSLANFGYNHPQYTYPVLSEDPSLVMEASGLAHPLIFEEVVTNDFRIARGNFIVITGANMAGKSTFLRSVALAILMANAGLPVSATYMAYTPIPLISSMRTSDSLSRQESYFFAELKRLKKIVDRLEAGPYFVVLDEILKGTNSKDKAKGSREFLERLLKMQATGLIATHDLSLCEVADELEAVHNYFFDAQIRDGELYFDYRFKPGVCSNMNASFLLRKLGVVKGESEEA
jgi:DNA mismatch repair ATPase MutS